MALQLSDRVMGIQQSASIAAKNRVTELQAAGRNIIDFTIGEPDLATPTHILEAAIAAMRDGQTHYTATAGIAELRTLISRKISKEAGFDYRADNVIVGSGAKQLIKEAFCATLNPGDEVIIPAPYWVSYPEMVKLAGGTPVTVKGLPEREFKISAQDLESAITPSTRWFVINSPNNPSGALYNRTELAEIASVLVRHPHVMIMTDDIYEHVIYDDRKRVNLVSLEPSIADRTLLVSGFSKSYAMTGWRVGYATGPKSLIAALGKLIGQSTTCASSISQAAAVEALTGDQSFLSDTLSIYKQRRDLMHSIIDSIPGISCAVPHGTFYLFPSVSALIGKRTPAGSVIRSDVDLVLYLLEAANVAVMDGTSYGLSPHLRLSYATSLELIEQGSSQIGAACAQLA